jgi:AcrR family transcriptional regulator
MTGGTITELSALPLVVVPRPDPRVRRTHRALHDAMVALCLEVGYRAVTIEQLVERAGVTRATFYTHFRDKEHLLAAIAEQVVEDVLERFQQHVGADRLQMLFEDAEREPDRLRVVLRGEGDGVALRLFTERVTQVIAALDEVALANGNGNRPLAIDAQLAARMMAGQIVEALRWWLEADEHDRVRLTRTQAAAQVRTAAQLGRLAADDPRRAALRGEEHS